MQNLFTVNLVQLLHLSYYRIYDKTQLSDFKYNIDI